MLLATRARLKEMYASDIEVGQKRQKKQANFEQLRSDYQHFKTRWNGYKGYDRWFSEDLNNAKVVSSATYRRLVPAFAALYQQAGGNMSDFFDEAKRLSKQTKAQREAYFETLLKSRTVSWLH